MFLLVLSVQVLQAQLQNSECWFFLRIHVGMISLVTNRIKLTVNMLNTKVMLGLWFL